MVDRTYTLTKLPGERYLILGDQDPPTRVEFESRFAKEYLCKWLLIDSDEECAALLLEVEQTGKASRTIKWGKFFTV